MIYNQFIQPKGDFFQDVLQATYLPVVLQSVSGKITAHMQELGIHMFPC